MATRKKKTVKETAPGCSDAIDINERLARIEEKLGGFYDQLSKLVGLFDRMVRVEERQAATNNEVEDVKREYGDKFKRMFEKLNDCETEITSIKTARTMLVWMVGVVASLLSGIGVYFLK